MVAIVYIGMIPAFSLKCRNSQTSLSLMNCFAGGVFLAMALIHILPEAAETYNEGMTEYLAAAHAEEVPSILPVD
jgi:zinc transporter ZupT